MRTALLDLLVPCSSVEQPGWLELRQSLWPHCSAEEHLREMASFLAAPERYAQYIAYTSGGRPIGFVEVSLRTDHVIGTSSSRVAFLEGIYVVPEFRGKGIGAELLAIVSAWATGTGCSELASDALLENRGSQAFHRALGFEETERVVFFRKALGTQ